MPARWAAKIRLWLLLSFALPWVMPNVAALRSHTHFTPAHSAPPTKSKTVLAAPNITGSMVDIAAHPGWKVVYFWSAACPCVRNCEQLTFLPLARQYKGKVAFYAIAANNFELETGAKSLRQEAQAHPLPYPLLLDRSHAIADALNARVTPHTFVLDTNNRVVFAGMPDDSREYETRTGERGLSKTYLARALSECLAGKKVSQSHTATQGCLIDR